jgi:hypothetical protein
MLLAKGQIKKTFSEEEFTWQTDEKGWSNH